MALALMLLAGAGLVIHGLQRFGQRDPGWRVEGVTAGCMTRVLLSLAPGLEGNAPGVVIPVTVLLFAVALGACWLPARRAARLDPVDALRTEYSPSPPP